MSEMKLKFGTNCSGLDMHLPNRGSDIRCTGSILVFTVTPFNVHFVILT